jgi:hypothetical protein
METKPNTQLKVSQGLTLSVAAFLAATSIAFAQDAPPAAPAEPPAATPVAEVPAAAPPPPAAPIVVAQPPPVAIHEPDPSPAPAAKPADISIGGTKISLYGFFQLNSVYEDGANNNQNWSELAPPNAEDGDGRFMSNVNQTRIGINVTGPQKEGEPEASGRFEVDFANNYERAYNGVGGLRIRQAFGQVKFSDIGFTLLLGQTSDLIGPLTAPTLNQSGLKRQGSLGTRRPMIRLSQVVGPIEIAAAATDDRIKNPVLPGFQGSIKAKIPAVWASEKQNLEFILSGHYAAEDSSANKKDDDWESPASWSGVASLSLPIINILGVSGEIFYGQNLNNYSNGSIGQSGTATGKGEKDGIQSLGGWGAVTLKLPANLSFAGGIGIEAIDENREKANAPNKNTTIFGNLKYNVTETAFIGFEYARLSTEYATDNKDADSGKLNRIELVFNYAFK